MGRKTPRNPVRRERAHQKFSDGIMLLYDGECHLCGRKGADTIDHVVPVAWGGSDHPANLKPAHRSCNSSKGADRPPRKEWRFAAKWLPGHGGNVSGTVHVPFLPLVTWGPLIVLLLLGFAARWAAGEFRLPVLDEVGAALIVAPLLINMVSFVLWWFVCRSATKAAHAVPTIEADEWLRVELAKKAGSWSRGPANPG